MGDFVVRYGCKGKFEDLKSRDELIKFLTLFFVCGCERIEIENKLLIIELCQYLKLQQSIVGNATAF